MWLLVLNKVSCLLIENKRNANLRKLQSYVVFFAEMCQSVLNYLTSNIICNETLQFDITKKTLGGVLETRPAGTMPNQAPFKEP